MASKPPLIPEADQQQNRNLNLMNDGALLIKEELQVSDPDQTNQAKPAEERRASGQMDNGQEEEKAFVIRETRKRKGGKLSKT